MNPEAEVDRLLKKLSPHMGSFDSEEKKRRFIESNLMSLLRYEEDLKPLGMRLEDQAL
jgi:hypothetical protein